MSAGTSPLEVESERTYVVYDRNSGEIVHIHRITVHQGAEKIGETRAEARALEVAAQFGQREDKVAVLRADDLDLAASYVVNVKTRELTAARPSRAVVRKRPAARKKAPSRRKLQ